MTTFENPYEGRLSVPEETHFYYSPVRCGFSALVSGLLAAVMLYMAFSMCQKASFEEFSHWLMGVFVFLLAGIFCWLTVLSIQNAFNKNVQVSISYKGIYTARNGFQEWEHIQDETIQVRGYRHRTYYLYYVANGTPVQVDIGSFNTTSERFDKLLRVYRIRYEQQKIRQTPADLPGAV